MPTLATVLSVVAFALSVTSFIVTLVFTIKRDIGPMRPALVFTYRSGVGWHVEISEVGYSIDCINNPLRRIFRIPTLAKASEILSAFSQKHDSKQVSSQHTATQITGLIHRNRSMTFRL